MGAKKGKKPLQEPKEKNKQKASTMDNAESAESSAIATVSFIEGLQQSNGAPLHSTALEEDLEPLEEKQNDKTEKRSTKKQAATNREAKENRKKPKSAPQKSKKPGPLVNGVNGKKAVKRKSSGGTDAARPVKKQKLKDKNKITESESESESGKSNGPQTQSQEQSDGGASPQSRRDVFSSDEEVEDNSWKPSPKKLKVKGFGPSSPRMSSSDKSRKSSSGSGYQPEKGRKKKKQKRSGVTELEVVLDEFLDFCEQYKEMVESRAVKQALDSFSSNVKDQLTEKITCSKQLKTVMRENSKVASAIRTKRQRLLDAKNELIKSERQLWLLQKDKSELEQNLEDLSRSKTFLKNIRELNKRYLQHRQKHPKEKETYGASSLPALLVEAKHMQTTELQLKLINDRLQKTIKDKEK